MGDLVKGIASLGMVGGLVAGEKQRKEKRRIDRAQRLIERRQFQRGQMSQLRQKQIAQARVTAGAASADTLDSSGYRGTTSSIGSTFGSNVAFQNQIRSIQDNIFQSQQRINRIQGWQDINSALMSAASMGMGSFNMGAGATQPQQSFTPSANSPVDANSLNSSFLGQPDTTLG